MKDKLKEVIHKIKNIEISTAIIHIFYNMYLFRKVYFGYGIVAINEKQEKELMKIYEPIILNKLRLSKKFLRKILYAQKSALGIGIMKLSIIIVIMSLRLYLEHKRLSTKVGRMISANR